MIMIVVNNSLNQRPSSEGIETCLEILFEQTAQPGSGLNQRPSSEGIETTNFRPLASREITRLNQRPSSEGVETVPRPTRQRAGRFHVSISALAPKGLKLFLVSWWKS